MATKVLPTIIGTRNIAEKNYRNTYEREKQRRSYLLLITPHILRWLNEIAPHLPSKTYWN